MAKPIPKVKEASVAHEDTAKQARMAEALRANLRRRKAQAREIDAPEAVPADPKAAPSRP